MAGPLLRLNPRSGNWEFGYCVDVLSVSKRYGSDGLVTFLRLTSQAGSASDN